MILNFIVFIRHLKLLGFKKALKNFERKLKINKISEIIVEYDPIKKE